MARMKLTALLDNSGQMERAVKKDKMDKRELKVRSDLLGRPAKMDKTVKVTEIHRVAFKNS